MHMVIRIKRDEDLLQEWVGHIETPSHLSTIVSEQLHLLEQKQSPAAFRRLTITTDLYGRRE